MQEKPSIRPSATVQHIKLNFHAQTINLSLTDVWGHAATYIYNICVYIYIYIYTYIHTYTYTYIYIYKLWEEKDK